MMRERLSVSAGDAASIAPKLALWRIEQARDMNSLIRSSHGASSAAGGFAADMDAGEAGL